MTEFTFKYFHVWPRESTPKKDRKDRPFNQPGTRDAAGGWTGKRPMPVARTYEDLRRELRHLGVAGDDVPVVIEVQIGKRHLGANGTPRADAPPPPHPGVILSFTGEVAGRRTPLKFMCDDCRHWEDNLRAIALTLERLRLADLYGVTKAGEQYRGWNALPPAIITPPPMTVEEAAEFVYTQGIGEILKTAKPGDPILTVENVRDDPEATRAFYRRAAMALHPDASRDESSPDWQRLQDANAVLEQHHAGKR